MTTLADRYQAPADARLAASLLLVRDGPDGLEVLMQRRAEREGDFRGGVAAFPGGVLEPHDAAAAPWVLGATDAALSRRYGLTNGVLAYAVAAVRETFEEMGLALVCDDVGRPVEPRAEWHAWRERLHAGEATLADFCRTFDVRIDLQQLACWSHWLTSPGMPKRFDTRFFIAPAPAGQEPDVDRAETIEAMWLTPAAALAPEKGLKLLPVQQRTLRELAAFATVRDALADGHRREAIPLTMPRRCVTRRGVAVVLPNEHAYAEVRKLDPAGTRQDVSSEITPGRAVQLSERVWRVTAPNAGVMTGPGTNSYFVGDAAAGLWALIDPGPVDAAHLEALRAAAPGPVTHVLATHTHVDHSPGCVAAAAAFGAQVWGRRPLRWDGHAPGQDASFAPDHEPAHDEGLELGAGCTLRALHTPGHAANHVCWLLEQERLLFTGDHVMQGSTVVINPPDGNMGAYLRSLAALLDESIDWLAPGHGFLVDEPHAVIRALIAHRLRREQKVIDALAPRGVAAIDVLLPEVYADTPAALHPLARRSLLAHLDKLAEEGRVMREGVGQGGGEGERWRWTAPSA